VTAKRGSDVDTSSYLRAAEAADILGVSRTSISRWAKEGKLPYLQTPGGHRRYPEAKLRELANQLREEPTRPSHHPR
jgi:excisionase family DNA binding protein